MASYRLVLSNPPQGEFDAEETARLLDLAPEQMVGKARYPVPEIWFAHPDGQRVDDMARALAENGCHVTVVSSDELASLPPRTRIRSFAFTERGFIAQLDGGAETLVPYDRPVVAVFCRPKEVPPELGRVRRTSGYVSYRDVVVDSWSPTTGLAEQGADTVPFLDVYIPGNGSPKRLTVIQNSVNFSGLGRVQPRAASNMDALVESCEDRFNQAHVDRRLVGMRLRARGGPRPAGSEHRRGFSYASPGLNALLHAVSSRLEAISQPELSARLAFLTQRPSAA
jgi:hypothetical protein